MTDADEEDVDSGWGGEDDGAEAAPVAPPVVASKSVVVAKPAVAAASVAAKLVASPGVAPVNAPKPVVAPSALDAAEPAKAEPAKDAAQGEAPKVEAPKVEPAKAAAKVEAPKAAAKVEAPKVEPAKADAKVEAPKAEAPKTEAPKVLPKAEPGKLSLSRPGAPKPAVPIAPRPAASKAPAVAAAPASSADAPKADSPKADSPKADSPKADSPKADSPKADSPKADSPKADAPSVPPSRPQSHPPGKPPSKAPPPKLAVGPRPQDKIVPLAPRPPTISNEEPKAPHGASVPESSRATKPSIEIDLDVGLEVGLGTEGVDELAAALAPKPTELLRATAAVKPPPDSDGGHAGPGSVSTASLAQPKSRSFTPRVTNAVQQARELDVRVASDVNVPTPPGTSVVQAALAASTRKTTSRPPDRPTPLRMPSVSASREAGEAPRPTIDARPQTTSLRFSEQPKPRPIPRDRKQTLKLNIATQNFALELLSRENDPASTPIPGVRPGTSATVSVNDGKSKISAPMLDLHLPDDISETPAMPAVAAALAMASDDGPEVEVSDEGHYSDSFDDLPIDEVLEAVRQSSMPPAMLNGEVDPFSSAPLRSAALHHAAPKMGDLTLGLGEEPPPISDMPPTVRGEPTDALRFGPASEAPSTVSIAEDPKLAPIRERFDRRDFTGALLRAEALLEEEPGHEGAKAFVQACQEKVKEMYISKLGSCESVLRVVMSRDAIRDLSFDHRGGFLISLIDGVATVDDVLDISGMPQLEALRLLYELKQEGVIDSGSD